MGIFLLVNINYILSFAYIDAIVHCNVPNVWNSALWACVCLWGANGTHIVRITDHGAGGFGSTGIKQLTQSLQPKDKKGTKKKNPLSPILGS